MKNHTALNSAQSLITKTVKHHSDSKYPDLFAGSHMLTVQKPVSKCYTIEQFVGTIAQRPEYYALLVS